MQLMRASPQREKKVRTASMVGVALRSDARNFGVVAAGAAVLHRERTGGARKRTAVNRSEG